MKCLIQYTRGTHINIGRKTYCDTWTLARFDEDFYFKSVECVTLNTWLQTYLLNKIGLFLTHRYVYKTTYPIKS